MMDDLKENQTPNQIEKIIDFCKPNQSDKIFSKNDNNLEQSDQLDYEFESQKTINDLCDDLLILIFKNFNVEELFKVEQVCKRWFQLAKLNRRTCLCLSLLGSKQNEHKTHGCENRLHHCGSKQRYIFGNFNNLLNRIIPRYEYVQTLHLNLQNLKSNQQKLLLTSVAYRFDNLVHFQLQINPESTSVYRLLIKLNFLCANRLQHLILCNTINYEAGDLIDLSLELQCKQRLKNEKEKYLNSINQHAHFKITCKFPHLRTFQSDYLSLQLPEVDNLDNSHSLKFLKRLRLDKCVIEEQEFNCLYKLFPNLENLSIRQLNGKQCLKLSTLFASTIQTLRVNEVDPQDFCYILNLLCSMRKLTYIKLMCTRLQFDNLIRTAIIQLQRNCPLLQKFILNKLSVKINALEDYSDYIGYWRTFDTINTILKRSSSDLKYMDLNKLEHCWPHIDLKHFLTALRHIRTLYFVTDNLIFSDFKFLFDKASKLRTLHFDYQTNNSKVILLNLVQHSPKLRVLKLNQVELSHNFLGELPKYCPHLVLLEINPKRFLHHPCKYNFIKLSELNDLNQLCLSNMRIHDRELSFIVKTCVNLAKLHVTSSRGLNGNTVYALKCKAINNPDVNYELNVDALVDTKYFNFYLLSNFLTSIDNHSFSKINFEPFKKLVIFTPSDEPSFLSVIEWDNDTVKFKDFKQLTHYFSNMKYYYIKKTENKEAKWTELVNKDDTLVPSHNGKILLEYYDSESFIF